MKYKCNDCGKTDFMPSKLRDVCQSCWDLRLELVDALNSQRVCPDEFREIQRVLGSRNGKGSNAIRRVLGICSPEI